MNFAGCPAGRRGQRSACRTRAGARRIILRAPPMDACAHECTTARARADTGGRSSQRQADRPSAATRRGPHTGPRIVPSGVAAAATHSPQLQLVVAFRVSGWVGFGRGRGPPCQGLLAAVGRPAPATSAAYYAAARLGERETNRCLGSAPRELLLVHIIVFARPERYRASLPSLPRVPCLALLPHHLFGETPQPRERRKNLLAGFGSAACRGCGEHLVRWRWEQCSSLIGVLAVVRGIKALCSCSRRLPGPCP